MGASQFDVIRCDVIGDFAGSNAIINSYQLQKTSSGMIEVADLLDDMVEFGEAICDIIKALSTAATVYRRVRVENVTLQEVYGEANFATAIAGTVTGDPNASGVAALFYARTTIPRVILRKFYGVLSESLIGTQGGLNSTGQAVMADVVTFLSTPFSATNGTYEYGYLSPVAAQWVVPTTFTFSTIPAYQRRRRAGSGS